MTHEAFSVRERTRWPAAVGRGIAVLAFLACLGPSVGRCAEPETGPLGKTVGTLPPGRYSCHLHVWESHRPEPERLRRNLTDAGLAGGVLFSGCSGSWHEMWLRDGGKAPKPEWLMDNVIEWCSAMPTLYPFYWLEVESPSALAEIDMAVAKGIYGFKIMTNRCRPVSEKTLSVYRRIAQTGKPVLFHTGILWDFEASSDNFRPGAYEGLITVPGLRFAMGHLSWPWVEECVAELGKFQYATAYLPGKVSEMFLDSTPGTPPARRKAAMELVWKTGYDVRDHICFGTDSFTKDFGVRRVRDIMAQDDAIFDELGLSAAERDSYYRGALQRFLFGRRTE